MVSEDTVYLEMDASHSFRVSFDSFRNGARSPLRPLSRDQIFAGAISFKLCTHIYF